MKTALAVIFSLLTLTANAQTYLLPNATLPLTGNEFVPIDQAHGNVYNTDKVTIAQILASGSLTCGLFTSTTPGCVPLSGGSSTNFLSADGTWSVPPGSSTGTVTSITFNNGLTSSPNPIIASGTAGLATVATSRVLGNASGITAVPTALTPTQLTTLVNAFSSSLSGAVPASGGGTTNFLRADGSFAVPAGTGITQLTGDVTASGMGSVAATLANTTVTPGSYTNANITVDSKGRLTAAASGSGGGVTGSGTINTMAKFTGATAVGNSGVTDDGTTVTATEATVINVPGTLGAELLSNPTFAANDTGWTLGAADGDTVWSSGLFTTTCTICNDESVSIDFASVSGHVYKVHVAFTITGDQNYIYFSNNSSSSQPSSGPNQDFFFRADYTGTDTVFFDFWNYNSGAVRLMTGTSIKDVSTGNAVPLTISSYTGNTLLSVDPLTATFTFTGDYTSNGAPNLFATIKGPDATAGSNGQGGVLQVQGGNGDGTGNAGYLLLVGGTADAGTAGSINLTAGAAGSGTGGSASMAGGNSTSGAPGGAVIEAGSSVGSIKGGTVFISSGNSGAGDAGDVNIGTGIASTSGYGGLIFIAGGTSSSGAGGDIKLQPGASGSGPSSTGNLLFTNAKTSDPSVSDAVWVSNGYLVKSGATPFPTFNDPAFYPAFATWTAANTIGGADNVQLPSGHTMTLKGGAGSNRAAPSLVLTTNGSGILQGGTGVAVTDSGGALSLVGGTGGSGFSGADIAISGGAGSGGGGSAITITARASSVANTAGGQAEILAGASPLQNGAVIQMAGGWNGSGGQTNIPGSILLTAGAGTSGTTKGGGVVIQLGAGFGGGTGGNLVLTNLPTTDTAVADTIWADQGKLVKANSGSAVEHVSYQPGLLTAVNATKAAFHKFSKASTVDNIEGSAATFSCVSNPTVTVFECGTSTTCTSPTTIGTVTVTAAGTVVDGSISSAAITAGDYVAFAMTAGTCASVDIAATVQTHVN